MTGFSFEHVFRAPSTAAVLAAYFDPAHLATQDELAGLVERTVTESTDDGARLRYLETMTWLERAIAEKMAQTMPTMAACTQGWLDRARSG